MTGRPRARQRDDFQVAVICALPLEYDAVAFAFDEIWDDDMGNAPGDSNAYTTGRIGSHNIVLLLLPGMGKASAASAAATLRLSYTGIKLAILTGVCGGVPSPGTDNELLLGDVVVSQSVFQYDLGRKYPDKFAPKDTVEESLGRPGKEVRSLVATFQTHLGRSRLQHRASRVLEQVQQRAVDAHRTLYGRPAATEDRLFEPGYLHRHRDSRLCGCSESGACERALAASCEELQCDLSRLMSRGRLETREVHEAGDSTVAQGLRILVGRVGSADTVMKAGLDRDRIAREYGLVAFEMEGAGVWDEVPCIVIKGVCDYADSHKNKRWQHFAAATAASTTKALLERYTQTDRPVAPRACFLVPYSENPDFIGRFEVLGQIKRLFGHEPHHDQITTPRPRVALYGLGGIGKTQIAIAYAFWLRYARPDLSVFWVHASNADRFRQSYSHIAQQCGVPGYEDPQADVLALVKTWLERPDCGQWLMVIDNADDRQLFFPPLSEGGSNNTHQTTNLKGGLGRYVPECGHGSVLITTRNKQVAAKIVRGKSLIEVGEMSEYETGRLVHGILDDKISAQEISTLSSRLEHLPLALAQAAAFMQENAISITKYLQLLENSDDSLLDQLSEPFEAVGRDSETPHAVTATWIMSFNQIQQQDALASDILSFASLLDRQGIPEKFIVEFCHKNRSGQRATAADVTKALGTLKAFSFISEAKDNTIDMHRLVQLVTRKWLENQGRLAGYVEQALEIVSGVFSFDCHENRHLYREYLPHANALLRIETTGSQDGDLLRASLLHCVAGYFFYLGQWKGAAQIVAQSIRLRKERLGEEHPDTLRSMATMALTHRDQGQWREAEELGERVMDISVRVLGGEHPDTLSSMSNLASTYMDQGRWEEAEELSARVIETRKRILGGDHPDTLNSTANLVAMYMDQGRWEEAEELSARVIETRKRILGGEHPYTLNSTANLVAMYMVQGRWEEAEALGVWVTATRKRVLGGEHPDTLTSMAHLANIWKDQGRWDEALGMMQDCARHRQQRLGADHPHTAASISTLSAWEEEFKRARPMLDSVSPIEGTR
ncbi:kinesin light chain [Colletotrichum tofieldiae]|uniref:Kinesin light chain n=1 Tax=Colletotrichum tofieldiae TaxID=708197 RepID=A0A166P9D4_9PEZI|nr:kinesin light chain [Colletotrichum tofieldiae]